jgi:hypothetical protein
LPAFTCTSSCCRTRCDAYVGVGTELVAQARLQVRHRLSGYRCADDGTLTLGHDAHAVLARQASQRLAPARRVGILQRGAQRLELDHFGVAELPRDQLRAVLLEQQDGRQRRERDHGDQQQHEAPEQRARPQDHDGASADTLPLRCSPGGT